MIELTRAEWKAYESFNDWLSKEDRRVTYEWDREYDGTEASGIAINDKQCERIQAAKDRLGISDELMRRFREMERERWEARA